MRTWNSSPAFVVSFGILLILSLVILGCTNGEGGTQPESNNKEVRVNDNDQHNGNEANNAEGFIDESPLVIYTSLFPLYDFAREIAGERGEVISLIPAGAEPHDYDPTPQDIIALSEADVFVYNGGGMEGWIDSILDSVNQPDLKVVDSTENIELLTNEETGHDHDHNGHHHDDEHDDHGHNGHHHDDEHDDHGHNGHHHDDEHHDHDHNGHHHDDEHDDHGRNHHHDHGDYDPHVWLDPHRAEQQAAAIKDALVEVDPDYADYYEERYGELVHRFEALDKQFEQLSSNVTRHDFVVSHEAFGYLAVRYGLNQVGITGISPSNEPSSQQLQEIIAFVEENDIAYILYENFVTPRVAENVKEEVGAEALVLHNLEVVTDAELEEGVTYFSIMEENLSVLQTALGYGE